MTPASPKFDTQPQSEGSNPYAPAGPGPLIFEGFQGINTSTSRYGVDDKQCYWMDGWMPFGPKQLCTMPDVGSSIYTSANNIGFFRWVNLGIVPYCIVFQLDGSVIAVNGLTQATTALLPAATIGTVLTTFCDAFQWAQQYIGIVANQPNGYWIWDGISVYGAGTIGPIVTITNVGSGYSSSPSAIVTGDGGTGVVISTQVSGGSVVSAQVVNPGSGFLAGGSVTLTFSGGNSAGSGASFTANLTHVPGGSGATLSVTWTDFSGEWKVTSAVITAGGSGYSSLTTVTVSVSGGLASSMHTYPTFSLTIGGGVVLGIAIADSGLWANPGNLNPNTYVTETITDNGGYFVTSVTVNNGGSGYTPGTTVTGTGGGSPVTQATYSPVISGGIITGVTVFSEGLYGSNSPPTLTANNTATNAAGTVSLMPFAIQGSTAVTYQQRVWVVNGNNLTVSAPGSFTDFSTADGGLSVASADPNLKYTYSRLVNSNGFLYLICDSSVSYISGVQTAGTPPTTTYTNQNADPEVGSPWPASVETWGRTIAFGNSYGVHLCYGAETTKISGDLDGFYGTGTNASFLPSSARAVVFSRKLWMMLANFKDIVAQSQVTKLLIWNGKQWWTSPQGVALTFIATQEINSVLTAYGTDGSSIYPMFQTPSANFAKTVQSKYWAEPGGYQFDKATTRLWSIMKNVEASSANVTFEIDSDANTSASYIAAVPQGVYVLPPQAVGQWGTLQGMTVTTTAPQLELWSAQMQPEIVQYKG